MQEEIINFIKQQRDLEVPDGVIREKLVGAGHSEQLVHESLEKVRSFEDKKDAQLHTILKATTLISKATMIKKKSYTKIMQAIMPALIFGILYDTLNVFVSYIQSLNSPLLVIGYLVLMILAGIGLVVSVIRGFASILYVAQGDQREISEIKKETNRYLGKFIWMQIIMSLTLLVGFLLFAVPGIILLVWFSFASVVLVVENSSALQSLLISRAAVKNIFWRVMWRMIVISVIAGVAMLFVSLITYPLTLLTPWAASLAYAIISNVVLFTWIFPLVTLYQYLLYGNAKLYHKGTLVPSQYLKWVIIVSSILGAIIVLLPILSLLITLLRGNIIVFRGKAYQLF